MPEFNLPATIETARINELALYSNFGPLSTSDYMMVWLSAFNKTCRIDTQALYTFFQGGGGGSTAPVILGDKYLHKVTALQAGGTQVVIPSLAGQQFFLERGGVPMELDKWNVLNAGGFELTDPEDELVEGELFLLHLYSLQSGAPGGTSSSSMIEGAVNISTNTTFDVVNHVKKILRLRENPSTHDHLTFTLPDISDIPENTIIPIEALVGNTVEHKVATQVGQLIYMNNTSTQIVYIRPGEVLWLYRGADGFYVMNDFYRIYQEIGKIQSVYKAGLNELVCKGQLLNRLDYPRLWAWVQTLGFSIVDDTTWNTAQVYRQGNTYYTSAPVGTYETILKPFRGYFSTGDGSTTFRLPDMMNMFIRGLKSETGTDDERYTNKAGNYQPGAVESHSHGLPIDGGGGVDIQSMWVTPNSDEQISESTRSGTYGGAETRPQNIGLLWVIKV